MSSNIGTMSQGSPKGLTVPNVLKGLAVLKVLELCKLDIIQVRSVPPLILERTHARTHVWVYFTDRLTHEYAEYAEKGKI